ncbi:CRISPR-associated endonuclease Cas1 [Candidatus Parcubacteria bacterium]|nr:MAG: CRISPR-associated endonuclease Cas1 [Candidatus Parcubacteria bacterium]
MSLNRAQHASIEEIQSAQSTHDASIEDTRATPLRFRRGKRIPLWLPYTRNIAMKKDEVCFSYNGGEVSLSWDRIHSILFYGSVCDLSQEFLDRCVKERVPLIIHRRNIFQAVWVVPSITTGTTDILTRQILFRENQKKRYHIARALLKAKFQGMSWLIPFPSDFQGNYLSVEQMRVREAHHARWYWQRYYNELGFPESSRRQKPHPLSDALDAVSKFVAGIILRWVLYHRLSPQHGFLHDPTNYPALVYDIMEPYRGYIERAIFQALRAAQEDGDPVPEHSYVGFAIRVVERLMDERVYTDATRQIVTFQELLHGNVLALRAYLVGDAARMMPPLPARPRGGRPRKAGYVLYGRSAGPTDFWSEARSLEK